MPMDRKMLRRVRSLDMPAKLKAAAARLSSDLANGNYVELRARLTGLTPLAPILVLEMSNTMTAGDRQLLMHQLMHMQWYNEPRISAVHDRRLAELVAEQLDAEAA